MQYNSQQIEVMREKLAEAEVEALEGDSHALYMALLEGFSGWNNIDDDEIIEKYLEVWGEFDG